MKIKSNFRGVIRGEYDLQTLDTCGLCLKVSKTPLFDSIPRILADENMPSDFFYRFFRYTAFSSSLKKKTDL